jgi:pimeloyl-ACP methyl ester carboxylesterase
MIPLIDFGGSGPSLYFAHANGYPPEAYRPFIETLAPHYHVRAVVFRPLWPGAQPDGLRDWSVFVDDLVQLFDERGEQNVIGVGHSLGAVVALAAALRRPELFGAVVLIDPVLFRRRLLWAWSLFRTLGLGHRVHPLIPGAKRRRRTFASVEEMFSRYRRAAAFNRFSDEALRVYVEAMAQPLPDGQVGLAYSPEWEIAVYASGPPNLWGQLRNLRPPALIVRGSETDTFLPPAVRKVQGLLPKALIREVQGAGHLAPLEKPGEVGRLIQDFLSKIG